MTPNGCIQPKSDYSLFTKHSSDFSLDHVLVYVDNIIIPSNNLQFVTDFKLSLNEKFKIKDLSLEVARSTAKCIFLSQRHYALEVPNDSGLLDSQATHFPVDPNLNSQEEVII